MTFSSAPTSLLRNGAGDTRRERPMTRNNNAAWSHRVLEDVMVAAMPLEPAVPPKPGDDLGAVDFRLGHWRIARRRKYWRIGPGQSSAHGVISAKIGSGLCRGTDGVSPALAPV
jgi:hypothetical protein